MKSLTAIDIDDTLFRTSAQFRIVDSNTGELIERVEPAKLNFREMRPNEKLCYLEFADAQKFAQESFAIDWMLTRAKLLFKTIRGMPGSEMILLTARSDLNDKDLFLDTFRRHSFPVDGTYVERAGNIGTGPPSENKKAVLQRYIQTRDFECYRLFDDSRSNLKAFLSLKDENPDLLFYAYWVDGDGRSHPFEVIENQPRDTLYFSVTKLADIVEESNVSTPDDLLVLAKAIEATALDLKAKCESNEAYAEDMSEADRFEASLK